MGIARLKHLNVVVLRARPSFSSSISSRPDSLEAALTGGGAQVHQLPVQIIEPVPDDDVAIKAQIGAIDSYQKAIFVSRYAAYFALHWLDNCQLSQRPANQCFAIGPTTAALLREKQIQVTLPGSVWSSEGLLALPEMNNVAGQNIIIFRGLGGRPHLGEVLAERGALVEYCELYKRLPDQRFGGEIIGLLDSERTSVLVALSGGALDALLAVGGKRHQPLMLKTPVIVPGTRLQNHAQGLGFVKVVVAPSPLAKDIERAITGWYTQA